MAGKYQKSKRTDHDIAHLTARSFTDFGEQQTIKYTNGLTQTLQDLADNPQKGREFVHGKTQRVYLYHRYISHVIYYRQRKDDIFIVRILHKKMQPEKHL